MGSLFCKYKQKNQTKFHPKRTSFNSFNTNKEMLHYCLRTQNWQYYILTKIFVNGYNHVQFFPNKISWMKCLKCGSKIGAENRGIKI